MIGIRTDFANLSGERSYSLSYYTKDALTDDQVKVLLDTVRELPPYLFIMIGLYSGLAARRNSWVAMGLCVP